MVDYNRRYSFFPYCVKYDYIAICSGQILNGLLICIGRCCSFRVCTPSKEVIVRPGECIGSQFFFFIINEVLIFHCASCIFCILIKSDIILYRFPDTKHCVIWSKFVSRDFCSRLAVFTAYMERIVFIEQVWCQPCLSEISFIIIEAVYRCSITAGLNSCPAFELITRLNTVSRLSLNRNSIVNQECAIVIICF